MKVVQLTCQELLQQVFRLRVEVWASEGVTFADAINGSYSDAHDQDSSHYGMVADGQVVAAARLSIHPAFDLVPVPLVFKSDPPAFPGPFALLSRLVVHPKWRDCRLGPQLIRFGLKGVRDIPVNTVLAYTTNGALSSYLQENHFSVSSPKPIQWGNRMLDCFLLARLARPHAEPGAFSATTRECNF
jgi:predicted GNAT family N-acyltransferase